LLHGKLPAEEKAEVMQKFADGELDMLVSTTDGVRQMIIL
jgi:ATP-dependent DNA helicase RecG